MNDAPAAAELERTRRLVLAHGWNSTVYQILNPGMTRWFAAAGDAVVAYRTHRRVRVVAGAPVCAAERLGAVTAEFERHAAECGERVCYFGAEARLEALVARASPREHALALLGAQPFWDPHGWAAIRTRRASLRAQLNRARNKGVTVAEWPAARAAADPGLRRCLAEWLATRGLPPLHFLVEPETLDRLYDRRVFVAERAGRPVGFVVASPVPRRNGWLIEQWPRGRGAPNGTAELMVDAAMTALAHGGAGYVTLGLAPLSARAPRPEIRHPLWLRLVLGWVRAHGRRFYNFAGLEAFKAKLQPDGWEAVFAIANEPRLTPATLEAIAGVFSGGSPVLLVGRAVGRAARTELEWIRKGS